MKELKHDELKAMNEIEHEDFVLINVLPVRDFNERHIRTSVNVPINDENFVSQVTAIVGDKQRKVVLYCKNFDCDASLEAAKTLEESGFTQVYDYSGGVEDWLQHQALEKIVG